MSSFWMMPAIFLVVLIWALATGEVASRRRRYVASRKEKPGEYWFWISFILILVILSAYGASAMPKNS
jgi:heme/copper-type cytochrome/quinol oxidase subunit 2